MKHEPEFRRAGWSLLFAALLMCASSARGAGTTPKPTPEAKSGKSAEKTPAAATAVPTGSSTEKAPAKAQPTAAKAEKTPAAPTPAPSSSKAEKTPAASNKPASDKAGKTAATESGTPAAGSPAGKTPAANAKPAAGKPKGGKAAAGTPGAEPAVAAVGVEDVVGGLKKPAVDCGRGNEFLTKALELNKKRQFDVALDLAARVEYDPKCDFSFVQASGLMAGIYVFETHDYEKGIAAAKKGLALDPRQTSLWFTAGYAQYQVDSFEEAAESFRRVFQHAPVVPLPENALRTARYLLGDAVDRNSMREGQTPEDQAIRMSEAITVWQEYQDFCEETTCEEAYLTHANSRITQLRQELQILRFKSNR